MNIVNHYSYLSIYMNQEFVTTSESNTDSSAKIISNVFNKEEIFKDYFLK